MTLLERILATPCPLPSCGAKAGEACDVERGMRPVRPAAPSYFCTSRIAAAEGASRAHLESRHMFPRMDITWQHGRWTKTCKTCGALTSGERGHAYYSHDNGKTWTPGPDACPGRRP